MQKVLQTSSSLISMEVAGAVAILVHYLLATSCNILQHEFSVSVCFCCTLLHTTHAAIVEHCHFFSRNWVLMDDAGWNSTNSAWQMAKDAGILTQAWSQYVAIRDPKNTIKHHKTSSLQPLGLPAANPTYPLTCSNPFAGSSFLLSKTTNTKTLKPKTLKPKTILKP